MFTAINTARDVMLVEEILQATFCGTNLPGNECCSCQNPVRTDDGGTAYVRSRKEH